MSRHRVNPFGRRPRLTSALFAVAALSSACGSLQPHEDIVRAAGGGSDRGAVQEGLTDAGSTTGGSVDSTTGTGTSGTSGSGATGTSSTGGTISPATSGSTGGSAAGTATGATGISGTTGTTGTTGSDQQDHSTITIGNVSTTSGIAGGAQRPGVVGLQAWVQYVNAKGGINGHPVRLIARDDQSDPNQNAAYTQALVEQSKVVAFVSNWASQTQQASAGFLKSKNVPVIGGDHTAQGSWGVNPMFFPVASVLDAAVSNGVSGLGRVAVPQGKKNLGVFVCAESAICTHGADIAKKVAPKFGFTQVYTGSASFASPGYTAECLNMKSKNVEALIVIFPASATRNIARDCAQQGVKMIYALANGVMEGDFNKDPSFEGSAITQTVFPFAGSNAAPAVEYANAMRKYAPNQISNPASASGWAAGKAFGEAVQRVKGPVTTAKLLAALHSFKNETIGGVTIPLTYSNGPIVPRPCYFLSVIKSGAYVPQNGGKFVCQ